MKVPNLKDIAVAWKRAANPTPEQAIEAERRMEICETCPEKDFLKLTRTFVCAACGCPLSKKVFAPGENPCPKGKWALPIYDEVNDERESSV